MAQAVCTSNVQEDEEVVIEKEQVWRHISNRNLYVVITVANEEARWPTVVVYSSVESGTVYARPIGEFTSRMEYVCDCI